MDTPPETVQMLEAAREVLTPSQQLHLESVLNYFIAKGSAKYTQGAVEHGGNIWELSAKQLLDNAIEEAIDQVVYLVTLKQQMKEFRTPK